MAFARVRVSCVRAHCLFSLSLISLSGIFLKYCLARYCRLYADSEHFVLLDISHIKRSSLTRFKGA